MQALPLALAALARYNQFLVYKLVPSTTRPGKTDKFPLDPSTGRVASAMDSNNWLSANDAIRRAAEFGPGHGVGFSFTEVDQFFFLDIDNCLDASGQWSALAVSLLNAFPGAAVEVSQSGKGLHIIGTGTPPPHGCKNIPYGLELYHADRFVALTGTHASGDASLDMSAVLPWLVTSYFAPTAASGDGAMIGWSDSPVEEWNGPLDDKQLIDRALRSKSGASVFGNRASFADLWLADVSALRAAYPDTERAEGYDASSADAALAQHLAFWTGKNCERVLNLMRDSGLARDKWEREDYLPRTISQACARQIDVLQDKPVAMVEVSDGGELDVSTLAQSTAIVGSTYVNLEDQQNFFRGCVYVMDQHKALVAGGLLLKPDQFRVAYGGYSFPMDPGNERIVRNAWEVFTESQAWRSPRADSSCFRPDLAPGEIVKVDRHSYVNTYWPIKTARREGDASPFLNHLAKVLPDTRDQQILLSYMAACVQYPGVKFQWAPLIQGVEGNGKTLFTRCVAFAVGDKYVHFPKASQIAKQFNGWMYGKIFIGVEDIYVPDSQREILEELKPMITGDRMEIESKGVDQITQWVCCNFMLNSNHKDGIRKTRNDRRFAPFYSAQQQNEDLVRDGMSNGYFPRLYDWLKSGGYEIVNNLLRTYTILDEFNPANGHIAPLTSSTTEAISYGLGRAEQEIVEAIEREERGFKGGWVSSMAVDQLLERIGASSRIPPNKRRELLQNIGYDYHPGLVNGRVNNTVLPDGGKPRLFVQKDSPHLTIPTPAEIARAYAMAQN